MKLFQNLRSKRMFYRILFLLLSMVCVMFLISFLFIGSYISRSYERQAQESARQLLGTASEYVDLAVLDLGRAMQQLLWNTDITGAILASGRGLLCQKGGNRQSPVYLSAGLPSGGPGLSAYLL